MSTALILGASRGLGLGLAREFAGRRWTVIGTVRREADRAALESAGVRAEVADITDPGSIQALHDRVPAGLDLLFINAGIAGPREFGTATPEEAASVFTTNAVAPIQAARALLDRMSPDGVLAFMSSIMGSVSLNTAGGMDLYRASKAALNSLTRSLVATLDQPRPVLTLHPGWVRTSMGGPGADLDVETSVRGLADVVLSRRGHSGSAYLDYSGAELSW